MLVRFNKRTIVGGTTYTPEDGDVELANDLADQVVAEGNGVVVGLGSYSDEARFARNSAGNVTGLVGPGWETVPISAAEGFGASVSASAATNATAINAALQKTGLVTLLTPGVIEVNETVIIPSNTHLQLGPNTTLKLANGANCSLIRNERASATASSVSMTASGYVVTATQVAHGLAVGDAVAIKDAAQHEYNGVWIVQTVPDADTFTFRTEDIPSATPATGSPLAKKADKNVSVSGGTFDGNEANQTTTDTVERMMIVMAAVHTAKVTDATLQNADKYCVMFNWASECLAENIHIPYTNSDGLDFRGPIRGGVFRQVKVDQSGDDPIAVCNGDLLQYEYARGELTRIHVEDVSVAAIVTNVIKINGGAGPTIRELTIKNIQGMAAGHCIAIADYTTGGATLTSTYVKNLFIENIRANTTVATGQVIIVQNSATVDNCVINGLRWIPPTSGGQTYFGVSSGGTVKNLTISGAQIDGVNVPAASTPLVGVGSSSTITQLTINGLDVLAATASMYGVLVDGTLTRAYLSNIGWAGGGFLFRVNAGATANGDLHLTNSRTNGTNNPVYLLQAYNCTFSGWKHSGSWPISINGTGTMYLVGDIDCSTTHMSIAGGMVVNVSGRIKADVTAIARQDGAICYNTNAAAGTLGAAGLVVCQGTAANSWHLIADPTKVY